MWITYKIVNFPKQFYFDFFLFLIQVIKIPVIQHVLVIQLIHFLNSNAINNKETNDLQKEFLWYYTFCFLEECSQQILHDGSTPEISIFFWDFVRYSTSSLFECCDRWAVSQGKGYESLSARETSQNHCCRSSYHSTLLLPALDRQIKDWMTVLLDVKNS